MPASPLTSRLSNGTIPDISTTTTTTATIVTKMNSSSSHDNNNNNNKNDETMNENEHEKLSQVLLETADQENVTMIRCPTTSSASSPPQSDDYNDNSSDTLSHNTDTLSADSCDSFCTTQQYPSSESKEELVTLDYYLSSPTCASTVITLDRIYQDNLSVEMLSLFEELLPTRESYERRMGLVRKIERLLNTEWPNKDIRVHLFGSSVNDLGTSQSDVDLCITTPWNGLRSMQHVVCVPRAKVPIVRLSDPESGLACDINVNNTLALQNTKMIKTYVALDPRVRPFIMIIKHWTKQRRLNDAANGGTLSTYTWTCMVINFLQMREPPILPVLHQLADEKDSNNNNNDENNDENESSFCMDVDRLRGFGDANFESLGGLLFGFFRRYAHEFDYEEQVVSVRHGQYLTKAEKGWDVGRNQSSLCVEEPFNVSRNLGNSADQASVQGLLVEFRRACHLLAAGASLDLVCEAYVPMTLSPTPQARPLPSLSNPSLLEEQPPQPQQLISDPSSSLSHSMLPPQPSQLQPPPHMTHNNARRMTHPTIQPSSLPAPLPSVVLPIHPHSTNTSASIDSSSLHHPHDRHRSPETIFIHPSSISTTTPSPSNKSNNNHHHPSSSSPYLQPIHMEGPATFRPCFNSTSSSSSSPYHSPSLPPSSVVSGYRVRNMRHSSHPLTCCTAAASVPGMSAPIAITIALPPPTSSPYVNTLQQHHPTNNKKTPHSGGDTRTVDSILARYSNKPPLPPSSRSRGGSTDYSISMNGGMTPPPLHHRRSSAASSSKGSNRRMSRQSSIDWPSISPTSSATLELARQQKQQQQQNRRRRWSTVKHDPTPVTKKTMADVIKEQHQEERVSNSYQKSSQQQSQPQQQQKHRSRHRPKASSSSSNHHGGGRHRKKHNNNNSNNNSNSNNSNNTSSNNTKSRH
ncbi:hypothetical protein BDA99DRAFT_563989 [Phascolomyces articulosus]|uniref:polynucleotide adenylyltransferase n=1 Tax=Phascolomyces articulosus TaxID=60185 RepID=A0AAD5P9I0_9FUNG|nr:hypothetical protein BDA99DRAFT_563989 [Phascolomyces articulosus]